MSISIEVTAEDIAHATRNDSYHCAVAEAVIRQVPGATRVLVDIQTIRYTVGDRRYVYLAPRAALAYIVAFDAGAEIAPFRFTLNRPAWSGTRVHAHGPQGYADTLSDDEEREGEATIQSSYVNQQGKRIGVRTRVKTSAPPALTTSGYRVYGLRALPQNREKPHA